MGIGAGVLEDHICADQEFTMCEITLSMTKYASLRKCRRVQNCVPSCYGCLITAWEKDMPILDTSDFREPPCVK
jgi:hypothetical protein